MKLEQLFEMQANLDNKIRTEHNLQNTDLLSKKFTALLVEFGELANETRCFKFWSNKGTSPKEVVIEEFVDCLHFILTIGIEMNFSNLQEVNGKNCTEDINSQFLNLFIDTNDLMTCSSKDHFITLFEDFLTLGISLGFSEDDIFNAYIKKNEINHERQNSGY